MIILILSFGLLFITWCIFKYTNLITEKQGVFLVSSSFLYIVLFGLAFSLLMGSDNLFNDVTKNSTYFPLVFYIIWFSISSIISNKFVNQRNYIGFFEENNYMSKRKMSY